MGNALFGDHRIERHIMSFPRNMFELLHREGKANESWALAEAKQRPVIIAAAIAKPGTAHTFSDRQQGKDQLVAVSYIPELKWQFLTAVDLDAV